MRLLRPKSGQSIDLFRMLAQEEGYTLSDPETTEKFITKLGEAFTSAKCNPIMLHGLRVQAMFEYIATSLGKCVIVKTEDAGSLHTKDLDIKVPDLRVLLIDGQEFFVEVKNFYQNSPFEAYRLRKGYLDRLQRYTTLFKKDLKLAIYWSKWNLWTLSSLKWTKCEGNKCSISLEDAFKFNEMASLGDYTLATLPPLKFRVVTDPKHPRAVNEKGEAIFTVGGIEMYCGNNHITVPREQSIALFLMLYGEWPSEGGRAIIENGELISFDFVSQPVERHPEQDFQMIGSMSGMISRRFNNMTAPEGEIERLSPKTESSSLGLQIPDDFQGEVLHLWRFIQQPSTE
jgi:hypothetical protein